MSPRTRLIGLVVSTVLVIASGLWLLSSRGDAETPVTVPPVAAATTTLPTVRATIPTTTTIPATTIPATTTTADTGGVARRGSVSIELDRAPGIRQELAKLYGWLAGQSPVPDNIDPGLRTHLADLAIDAELALTADLRSQELSEGKRVAVARLDDDIVLLADEADGAGWQIVGAKLTRLGSEAWYGNPVRMVFVIGSDARPDENPPFYRADSLHILTVNTTRGSGAVVGFPRDSWVPVPYGANDKFTHTMANRGPEVTLHTARDVTGLPLEGYLMTGFAGFEDLVDAFGGVFVDVPFAMAEPKSKAYLDAGPQVLDGSDALAFSRNRTLNGGDFTRSFHQGLVIYGALLGAQERDPLDLPLLLTFLDEYTYTDLGAGQLLTLAATAFEVDPSLITNLVLPGSVGTAGGASVVFLDAAALSIYDDLRDGVLDN